MLLNPYALAASGGGGGLDPHFANVSLLLHLDGTSGSTTFTDSSPVGVTTLTPNGGAQIETTDVVFGTGAMLCSGASLQDSIHSGGYNDLGTGDFTIELWVIPTANFNSSFMNFGAVGSNGFNFGMQSGGGVGSFYEFAGSNSANFAGSIVLNTPNHCVLQRDGNNLSCYLNGTRIWIDTGVSGPWVTPTSGFYIGLDSASRPHIGQIDEIRITKGVARYSGTTITVPTAAFPDS